jgi:hypothetical protein
VENVLSTKYTKTVVVIVYLSFKTKCWLQNLKKFGTFKLEFFFYWPESGTFSHFPVHINKNGKTVGFGESHEMSVTIEEPAPDTSR